MNYKDQLSQFSEALVSGQAPSSTTEATADSFKAYFRNRVMGAVVKLSDAYPATLAAMEKNNFRYFVKLYLDQSGMKSPNINDFVSGFPEFIASVKDIHQDESLEHLATLDRMWAESYEPGVYEMLPQGLFYYWQSLVGETEFRGKIDYSVSERIQVIESEGDLSLMLLHQN